MDCASLGYRRFPALRGRFRGRRVLGHRGRGCSRVLLHGRRCLHLPRRSERIVRGLHPGSPSPSLKRIHHAAVGSVASCKQADARDRCSHPEQPRTRTSQGRSWHRGRRVLHRRRWRFLRRRVLHRAAGEALSRSEVRGVPQPPRRVPRTRRPGRRTAWSGLEFRTFSAVLKTFWWHTSWHKRQTAW